MGDGTRLEVSIPLGNNQAQGESPRFSFQWYKLIVILSKKEMSNKPSEKPSHDDAQPDEFNEGDESSVQDSASSEWDDPADLLLKLATDDRVETANGVEFTVEDARAANDTALLTKSELQRYDDYKKQWTEALERPQESLEVLALREKQIIDAARDHDWETLDRLQKEIEADLLKIQHVFRSMGMDS